MEKEKTSNPYSAPTAEPSRNGEGVDFAPIIRRWERLRFVYNAVLIGLVLLVTLVGFPQNVMIPGYWVSLVAGGLVANLCFLTGPAVEGYGTYFAVWNRGLTLILFCLGLGLTAMLACVSVASFGK